MIELAASFNLECAHRNQISGKLHGHSYVVTVWFKPADPLSDIECHAVAIRQIGALLDHTDLDESCGGPRMENIAEWLAKRVSLLAAITPTRINVCRPTLGLQAEWRQ